MVSFLEDTQIEIVLGNFTQYDTVTVTEIKHHKLKQLRMRKLAVTAKKTFFKVDGTLYFQGRQTWNQS